ncbi:MAG: endonuclease domain-containing protein [Gemmatimonadota bacterium]|nr:endonuclease domain-containing protein [Gemmatimonadota bacterium]
MRGWRVSRAKRITPRGLRRRSTPAERKAWRLLRNRRLLGLKFRRQHPIAGYIVDFYCAELRLVIELDGGYHDTPEQRARDAVRTAALHAHGATVVRLRNSHISDARLHALIQPHVPPLRASGEGARG